MHLCADDTGDAVDVFTFVVVVLPPIRAAFVPNRFTVGAAFAATAPNMDAIKKTDKNLVLMCVITKYVYTLYHKNIHPPNGF